MPPALLLALLVARVTAADDADYALAAHHLAVLTDFLDRSSNLHGVLLTAGPAAPASWALQSNPGFLLVPIHDAAALQVVWRKLHRHLVPRKNSNEMHPHLAGDVSEHNVARLQLHPEHGVGQGFNDRAFDLNAFLFRQTLFTFPRPPRGRPG